MRDPFLYSDRWDSVGLDCSYCNHEKQVEWPNKDKDYACVKHSISLACTLMKNGYKEGEWFCSNFNNNGKVNEKALEQFKSIQPELNPEVLYGAYGTDGQLKEIPFGEIRILSK